MSLQENLHNYLFPIGTVIDGTYIVQPFSAKSEYMSGGFAFIQKVHHLEWDLDLAVKSPKPKAIQTQDGLEKYENECLSWLKLSLHPNIVTCYQIRRIGEIPRLFFEYIKDGSVRDWIVNGRLYVGGPSTAVRRILDIAIQMGWGLVHAHQQEINHLDIKPANVMMGNNKAKLTDFGLATVINQDGDSTLCDGISPAYCSPEQFESFKQYVIGRKQGLDFDKIRELTLNLEPVTFKSDIWSFGVALFAMFYGVFPQNYSGQLTDVVYQKYVQGTLSGGHLLIPKQLQDLLEACLQKLPEMRPESMQTVVDELLSIYNSICHKSYGHRQPKIKVVSPEYYCNHGASLIALNQTERALDSFDQGIRINPWHIPCFYNKLLTKWHIGEITDIEIQKSIADLIENTPDDPQVYYAEGYIQGELGNLQAAELSFDKAKQLENSNGTPLRPYNQIPFSIRDEYQKYGNCDLYPQTNNPNSTYNAWTDKDEKLVLLRHSQGNFSLYNLKKAATTHRFPNDLCKEVQTDYFIAKTFDNSCLLRCNLHDICILELLFEEDETKSLDNEFSDINQIKKIEMFPLQWGTGIIAFDALKKIECVVQHNKIDIIDYIKGVDIGQLLGHNTDIRVLYVSNDGKWLVSSAANNSLRLWNLNTFKCTQTFTITSSSVSTNDPIINLWMDKNNRFVCAMTRHNKFYYWNVSLLCNYSDEIRAHLMMCYLGSSEELTNEYEELHRHMRHAMKEAEAGNLGKTLQIIERMKKYGEWKNYRMDPVIQQKLYWIGRHTYRNALQKILPFTPYRFYNKIITCGTSVHGLYSVYGDKDGFIHCFRTSNTKEEVKEIDDNPPDRVINGGQEYTSFTLKAHTQPLVDIDITSDGRYAVSTSNDANVCVWNMEKQRLSKKILGKFYQPTRVRFTPEGNAIIVCTKNGIISIVDSSRAYVFRQIRGHSGAINDIAISLDARYIVTGGDDRKINIRDMNTFSLIRTFECQDSEITRVQISPDMQYVYAGNRRGQLLIYNVDRSEKTPAYILEGHNAEITALCPLLDSNWLITGSKDKTIRIWDLKTHQCMYIIDNTGVPLNIITDKTNFCMMAVTNENTIRQWELVWNYTYPRPLESIAKVDRLLRVVCGYYLLHNYISVHGTNFKSEEFFGPRSLDHAILPGLKQIDLPKIYIDHIVNDMEYYGYGIIQNVNIQDHIKSFFKNWPGLLCINADNDI